MIQHNDNLPGLICSQPLNNHPSSPSLTLIDSHLPRSLPIFPTCPLPHLEPSWSLLLSRSHKMSDLTLLKRQLSTAPSRNVRARLNDLAHQDENTEEDSGAISLADLIKAPTNDTPLRVPSLPAAAVEGEVVDEEEQTDKFKDQVQEKVNEIRWSLQHNDPTMNVVFASASGMQYSPKMVPRASKVSDLDPHLSCCIFER